MILLWLVLDYDGGEFAGLLDYDDGELARLLDYDDGRGQGLEIMAMDSF